MSSELTTSVYNYDDLKPTQAEDMKAAAIAIQARQNTVRKITGEAVLDIGQHLSKIHAELAGTGRDGKFRPWVMGCCGCSIATAYAAMRVFARFGGARAYIGQFDASALYALSADSCPEAVVRKACVLASKGTRVTHSLAKSLVVEELPAPAEGSGTAFDFSKTSKRLETSVVNAITRWEIKDWPILLKTLRRIHNALKKQMEATV